MVSDGRRLWFAMDAFRKAKFKDEDVACILGAISYIKSIVFRAFWFSSLWYCISGMLARIRINAFRIDLVGGSCGEDLLLLAAASVESEGAVGHAVYLLPSFYNHDCDPNAHILWLQNADARLKTLCDVEEGCRATNML